MITQKTDERVDGKDVLLFTLENSRLRVVISNFGATVRSILFKSNSGEKCVTMGAHSVEDYFKFDCYCGGTVGRVSNRIAGGQFALNGTVYKTEKNDNENTLHGGFCGFDKKFFDYKIDCDRLILSLVSPDSDGGFPGTLEFTVIYYLDGDALKIEFEGKSDKDTFFAPTNHTYFTLGGESVSDVRLKINADRFTPVDDSLIATGELKSVIGTPFDFTEFKNIGADIDCDDVQLKVVGGGYDHNFALRDERVATAVCDKTKIGLEVFSDLPGVQLYTGNFLNGIKTQGRVFNKHSAFCLEPQFFPNAVNVETFVKPLLKAGEKKSYYIVFGFYDL